MEAYFHGATWLRHASILVGKSRDGLRTAGGLRGVREGVVTLGCLKSLRVRCRWLGRACALIETRVLANEAWAGRY